MFLCIESVLKRISLKKKYEDFVGKLATVRSSEVYVLERCPYREIRLYCNLQRFPITVKKKKKQQKINNKIK